MKIFFSWSGERSGDIARALAELISYILPSVRPWISLHDIAPGARWAFELASELEGSQFGIVCITRENISSPWMLFETGYLAKQVESARVVPYLIDLRPADVAYPLAQFQAVEATRAGTRSLLQGINYLLDSPIREERLEKAFEKWWPDLEKRIKSSAEEEGAAGPIRGDRELLEELLDIARKQYSLRPVPLSMVTAPEPRSRNQGARTLIYWHKEVLTFEEGSKLADFFEKNGFISVLVKHRDPAPPDSVFIGALIGAEDARLVLSSITYTVRYIFRPDLPASIGGDDSGLTIGIGYMSNHYPQGGLLCQPVPVTKDDIEKLVDPGLSNTEFQAILRQITWPVHNESRFQAGFGHGSDDDREDSAPPSRSLSDPPSRDSD